MTTTGTYRIWVCAADGQWLLVPNADDNAYSTEDEADETIEQLRGLRGCDYTDAEFEVRRDRELVVDAVAAELAARGHTDLGRGVWDHVNGCWPTDDTVEELANGFEEMMEATP